MTYSFFIGPLTKKKPTKRGGDIGGPDGCQILNPYFYFYGLIITQGTRADDDHEDGTTTRGEAGGEALFFCCQGLVGGGRRVVHRVERLETDHLAVRVELDEGSRR